MYMVLLINDDPTKWRSVLDSWTKAGAPGVTVMPSTGLNRIRNKTGLFGDIPLMPTLADFVKEEEDLHHTIFSIIRDREVVDKVITVTQEILGDLNKPDTGILVVLPVLEAYGLDKCNE